MGEIRTPDERRQEQPNELPHDHARQLLEGAEGLPGYTLGP
jgi:hypothetical protein